MSSNRLTQSSPEREPIRVAALDALIADGWTPRNKPWTEHEEDVLREYYGQVPARAIAESLGRSLSSILNKAGAMGLRGSAGGAT